MEVYYRVNEDGEEWLEKKYDKNDDSVVDYIIEVEETTEDIKVTKDGQPIIGDVYLCNGVGRVKVLDIISVDRVLFGEGLSKKQE